MTNKKRKRHSKNDASNKNQKSPTNQEQKITLPSTTKRTKSNESSSFLEKMRAKLSGGHFRMINEKLYTCTGKEALHYFREDSSLFNLYHEGYKTQMSNWPEKPVNVIIKWLKNQNPSFVVADFGCGEALISKSVKNTVFSLDLVSNNPDVIACDMANTPLGPSSADVAVFCLSLMGTNYQTYLEEAYRVLKPGGWLLIAEVKSRFDPNNGGAEPEKFSKAISELGFNSYSFGHPGVDVVAANYLQQENNSSDSQENSFDAPNMENLNQELAEVLAQIRESEKQAEKHDEILKKNDAKKLSELSEPRDSYRRLQDLVKLRLSDIEISEYMMLLAQDPVVGVKAKSAKKKRRKN